MLRDILVAWNGVMEELHILFKDNHVSNSKEDGESSIGVTQKKKWEEANLFPNADFSWGSYVDV
ncbi:unnamed protein product [Arabidopsis thaliana]|uniref:(thale cress) hypothetical protein n=1 Tax=Arabidopsis thaliana TaxID=3702 RepID=A0A7G2ESD9_ARATH|nr:unnamed protein product [Arabidopsis thaliana]